MMIFQNSSLIEYSIGFFLFETNNSLLSEKYWSTLAVVSTALIGFSLTAYNVYRTRIERAAADPICRKYSFIEDSFISSWRLMIIAMMMFLIAFSLSLYFVVLLNSNNIAPSVEQWLSTIQYVTYGLLGWAIYCCLALWNYIRKFLICVYKTTKNKISNYRVKGKRKLKELRESSGQFEYIWEWLKYHWQLFNFAWESFKSVTLSIMYGLIIAAAVGYLFRGATFFINLLQGNDIGDLGSKAQEIVIFSIVIGLLIMYSEYSLFQPKNILFNVENSTKQNLQNTINDINDKCEAFKFISDWLKLKVKDAKEKAKDVIEKAQKNDNEKKFLNFSKFETADFVDAASLCGKLKAKKDSISALLYEQFEPDTKDLLSKHTAPNPTDANLINSLVRELNNLLERPSFYEREKFKNVTLSKKTKNLIQDLCRGEELISRKLREEWSCLNRMLLEDVYPNEIIRKNSLFITEELLLRAEESIEGNHRDTIKDEGVKLIELKDRHTKSLKQFIDRGYATYEEIISEMNGIELYLEGLNKYEMRLKELPAQIDLLINELSFNSEKNTETMSQTLKPLQTEKI